MTKKGDKMKKKILTKDELLQMSQQWGFSGDDAIKVIRTAIDLHDELDKLKSDIAKLIKNNEEK